MLKKNYPDAALLTLRVMVGMIGVFHGSQKLFGAFGGGGPRVFASHLESLGVPLPLVNAYLAGLAECAGGLLVGIGLFTRPAAIPFAFTMAVAIWSDWNGGFDVSDGDGFEYALTVLALLVGVFLAGAGRYSGDHIFRSQGTT
jgi:putative oxidoreductase